jgi:hypothetical protein
MAGTGAPRGLVFYPPARNRAAGAPARFPLITTPAERPHQVRRAAPHRRRILAAVSPLMAFPPSAVSEMPFQLAPGVLRQAVRRMAVGDQGRPQLAEDYGASVTNSVSILSSVEPEPLKLLSGEFSAAICRSVISSPSASIKNSGLRPKTPSAAPGHHVARGRRSTPPSAR